STETRNIGIQVDVLVTKSRKECTPAVIVRPWRAKVAYLRVRVNALQMKLNSVEMSQPKKVSQVDQQYQQVFKAAEDGDIKAVLLLDQIKNFGKKNRRLRQR